MGNKKTRVGSPAEIAKLDFHSWDGRLIDRTKAKTTEKDKGMLMWDNIGNRFGFTLEDFIQNKKENWDKELQDIREMQGEKREEESKPKLFQNLSSDNFNNLRKPIEWKFKNNERRNLK